MTNFEPGAGPSGLSSGSFAAALGRFLSESQVEHAVAERSIHRWREQQLAEGSSFTATLINLAESQTVVGLALISRDILRCTLTLVGLDVVLATDDFGNEHLISHAGINRVESQSARSAPSEGRALSVVEFWQAAGVLAEERPQVSVHHLDGSAVRGELRGATADELRLRVRDPKPATLAVRRGSVSHISARSW